MYARARAVSTFVVRCYYRWTILGSAVPAEGPVILVSNHTNGLVDAVFVAQVTPRELRFLAKFKLMKMPFLGYIARGIGAVPVYRKKDGVSTAPNQQSFEAVFAALRRGELISVFPEGSSHSEPQLQPLKTGAARLALGAEAQNDWALGVQIVPVGCVYFDRDAFQSRVDLWVGEPLTVTHLAADYERDEWGTVKRLTADIDQALRQVTINLERHEERPLLELAERLWPPDGTDPTVRLQALAQGLPWLHAHRPGRARALLGKARELDWRLRANGLDPTDLERDPGPAWMLRFVLRNALVLGLALPAMLVGLAAWGPPLLLAQGTARLPPIPRDKYVTALLLASLVVLPLWLAAAALAAGLALGPWAAPTAAVLLLLLGYAHVRLWRHRWAVLHDLSVLFNLAPNARLRSYLRRERDELAREMEVLHRLMRKRGLLGGSRA